MFSKLLFFFFFSESWNQEIEHQRLEKFFKYNLEYNEEIISEIQDFENEPILDFFRNSSYEVFPTFDYLTKKERETLLDFGFSYDWKIEEISSDFLMANSYYSDSSIKILLLDQLESEFYFFVEVKRSQVTEVDVWKWNGKEAVKAENFLPEIKAQEFFQPENVAINIDEFDRYVNFYFDKNLEKIFAFIDYRLPPEEIYLKDFVISLNWNGEKFGIEKIGLINFEENFFY